MVHSFLKKFQNDSEAAKIPQWQQAISEEFQSCSVSCVVICAKYLYTSFFLKYNEIQATLKVEYSVASKSIINPIATKFFGLKVSSDSLFVTKHIVTILCVLFGQDFETFHSKSIHRLNLKTPIKPKTKLNKLLFSNIFLPYKFRILLSIKVVFKLSLRQLQNHSFSSNCIMHSQIILYSEDFWLCMREVFLPNP